MFMIALSLPETVTILLHCVENYSSENINNSIHRRIERKKKTIYSVQNMIQRMTISQIKKTKKE